MKYLSHICFLVASILLSPSIFALTGPQNFSATVAGSTVGFSWAPVAVSGECYGDPCTFQRYSLQQSGVGNFIFVSSDRNKSSFVLNNLVPGQYTFTLWAYYQIYPGEYGYFASSPLTVTVSSTPTVPAVPASISGTQSGASIAVNWSTSLGATRYELQRNSVALTSVSTTSYSDATAMAGSSYTYRVRACNAAGCSGWVASSAINLPTIPVAPAVPTNLSSGQSGLFVRVIWNASVGVTHYELQRNSAALTSVSTTHYLDNSVISGTAYTYRVRACNNVGCSGWATAASVTFFDGAPKNFSATVAGSTVGFSWASVPVSGECYGDPCTFHHYSLQQSGVSNFIPVSNDRNKSSFVLNNLAPGQYTFTLWAYYQTFPDEYGGFATLPLTVTVSSTPTVPAVPASISGTQSGASIAVNWSTSLGATRYELQRNSVALTSVSTTSYSDATAMAGSSYTYRVRACNASGCSGWVASSAINLPTIPVAPAVPENLSSGQSGLFVAVNWTASVGATHYELQRNSAALTSVSTTHYPDNSVISGTAYTYRVRACNNVGCSGWATAASMTFFDGVPKNFTGTVSGLGVSFSWAPVPASGICNRDEPCTFRNYSLQRSGVSEFIPVGNDRNITSFVLNNLAPGQYSFILRAYYQIGPDDGVSFATSSVSATVLVIPPASISATQNGLSVEVNWAASSGAVSYELQRNSAALTSVNATSHSDTTVAAGGSYTYRVRACNASGCSGWKSSSAVNLPAIPVAPTSISGVQSGLSILVNWLVSSGATSYELQRNSVALASVSGTGHTDTTIVAGGNYTYRVRACNASGCSGWKQSSLISLPSFIPNIPVPALDKTAVDPINDSTSGMPLYTGNFTGSHTVANDGSFNYSIPVVIPPGINGMEPELSLTYNSKRGNGMLGYGWAVSEVSSSISRCSSDLVRDGKKSGTRDDDAFKYCLDGTRLVEVSLGEYRLEDDPSKKIVMQNGSRFPLGWKVYSNNGKIHEYGGATDAVVNQAEYFLKKKQDSSGNYVSYTYTNDSSNGTHKISSISYTKNDNGLQGLNNQILFSYKNRLDTISYYSSGYKKQVLDRLDKITIKVGSSEVRSYRINYEAIDGNLYADPVNTSRITKIAKCDLGGYCSEIGFKWNDFDVSKLSADLSGSDYSLTEYDDIEESNYIVDGDEQLGFNANITPLAGERFLYGNDFVIGDFDGDNKKEALWKHCTSEASCKHYVKMSKNSPALLIADVPEVFRSESIKRSAGTTVTQYVYDRYRGSVIDINNDGIDDYYLNSMYSGIKFYVSDGSQLSLSSGYSVDASTMHKHGAVNFNGGSVEAFWGYASKFIDVNGDGLLDLIKMPPVNENINVVQSIAGLGETGIYVAMNTGVGFSSFIRWGTMTDYKTSMKIPVYYEDVLGDRVQSKNFVAQFADVNGDGLKDILGYLPGVGVEVGINTGNSFLYQNNWANWAAPTLPTSSDPRYVGAYACPYYSGNIYLKNIIHETYRYGDVNGDGLTDIVFLDNNGIYVSIATGSSYLPPVLWSNELTLENVICGTTTHDGSSQNGQNYLIRRGKADWRIVDFNKDGLGDIAVSIKNTEGTPSQNHTDIMFSRGGLDGQGAFSSPLRVYSDNWDYNIPFPINEISISENGDPFVIKGKKATPDQAGPQVRFESYSKIYDRGMYRIPIDSHEIKEISTKNGSAISTVNIKYKNLNRNASIYLASVRSKTEAPFSPKTPMVHSSLEGTVDVEYDPTRSAYAPMLSLVSQVDFFVNGDRQNDTKYKYENYRFDQKGWGSLGFEKIENTVTYSKKSIVTSTEYLQEIGAGYVLVKPTKTTKTVIRLQDADHDARRQIIKEDKFSYKVRSLADDIDDYKSPRFFSFIFDHEEKKYDFDSGSLASTNLWRSYNDDTTNSCPIFTDVNAPSRLSNQNLHFDDFGSPLDITQYHCDSFGVVGARNRNTNIENDQYLWHIGLIKDPYVHSWIYDLRSDILDAKVRHSSFTFDDKGRVESEIREPNAGANIKLTINRTYNAYGGISGISETVADFSGDGVDFTSRAITKNETYEENGDRSIETINEYGHVLTQIFEPVFGFERDTIDANGLVASRLYDRAGRLTKITFPDATTMQMQYRNCNSCLDYNDNAAWLVQTKVTGKSAQVEYFDGMDRIVGTKSRALNGGYNYTINEYNSDGTLYGFSAPFRGGETIFKTIYEYDALGRAVLTVFPNSGAQRADYHMDDGVVAITTTDSLGNIKIQQFDALGREKNVIDNLGTIASYDHDAFGNIRRIEVKGEDGESPIVHVIDYDILSRKTALNDPDVGEIIYTYNAFGHLVSQKNAVNETIKYFYDKLDRQVKRTDPPSTTDLQSRTHTWTYDNKPNGIGRLGGVAGYDTQGMSFSEQYAYNVYGQLDTTDFVVNGNNYKIINHYDNFSRSLGLTYPTGYTVGFSYNQYGFNDKVYNASDNKNLWAAKNDDSYGHINDFAFGNEAKTLKVYDPSTGLIDTIQVTKGTESIQSHDYDFDTEGNLRKRQDNLALITQNFCYDSLYRLTDGLVNNTCNDVVGVDYSNSQYGYDIHGNILKKGNIIDYRYGENAGPHAVTYANGQSYQYDSAGRMKSSAGRIIEYSAFGKPVYMTKDSYQTQVVYGPLEKRIRRMDIESGALTTTTYIDKLYEKIESPNGTEHRHYIGDFGIHVVDEAVQQRYNVYQHFDHIGSLAAKTDDKSTTVANTKLLANEPWGQRQEKNWSGQIYPSLNGTKLKEMTYGTTRGFTGHEHLDGVGLIHMNGRVYDPVIGRFLTPDPWIQDPKNPQSFNRYSYVWNNPLRYTDPTGEFIPLLVWGGIKLVGAGVALYGAYETGNSIGSNVYAVATGEKAASDAVKEVAVEAGTNALLSATGVGIVKVVDKVAPNLSKQAVDKIKDKVEGLRSKDNNTTNDLKAKPEAVQPPQKIDTDAPSLATDSGSSNVDNVTKRVEVSASKYPETAKHIQDAQAAGHPKTLTIDRAGTAANREASLDGVLTKKGLDRDEYPPAMFQEGGSGASVRHINPADNRGAGASIGAQCRGQACGTQVSIEVVD